MSSYDLKGRYAVVTGAGSGINLAFTELLLESGCSVVLADVKLLPAAEELVAKYPHPPKEPGRPSAVFRRTDVSDWAQLSALWEAALGTFPRVELVVNGAGLYEPPSSSFWNAPGASPLSGDDPGGSPGVYRTFAVNTMGPVRLAQIAIDYWLENRQVQGNLLWVASLGAVVHSMQTPMYFASKAAIVSVVKSFAGLRKSFGIRNSAICPGACYTPIFHPAYCSDRVRAGDLTLTPQQCASVMLRIAREPQYGDGNIVETMLVGTRDRPVVNVREIPLEALYPTVGPVGEDNHLLEEEQKLVKHLQEKGMRVPYGPSG